MTSPGTTAATTTSTLVKMAAFASRLPVGEPVLDRARDRAVRAVEIVTAAVDVDPTLLDEDRSRDLDVFAELLRQLKSMARQAASTIEHARLTACGAPRAEFARIGKINPCAPEELDALSEHAVMVAGRVSAAALPDWNTPERIQERSVRLLPSSSYLTQVADDLAAAVQPAAALPYPSASAVELAALAVQLRRIAATIGDDR